MKNPDQIQRFLFDEHAIRGQHISLDSSWKQIVSQSKAKGIAQTLLGHALAAAALLVETLKIDGSVSLQIRGTGAIHLLVVEATSQRTVRGIIRQSREPDDRQSLAEIFESDKLVITIKNNDSKPYQGIVALTGNNLATALQAYFDQSEQLPTQLWFACDHQSSCGLLLQKLPEETQDVDAWNRITLLASTTEQQEFLTLSAENLLQRLFHEENLRLFAADSVSFSCSCSPERIRDMLISLGKSEIDDMIAEQGEVSITCEFCNRDYQFDRIELGALIQDSESLPLSSTRH